MNRIINRLFLSAGSRLESAVAEGSKALYEFIVTGQVPELHDVMDQIREEYMNLNRSYSEEDSDDMQDISDEPPPPPPKSSSMSDMFTPPFSITAFQNASFATERKASRFFNNVDQDMRQSGSTSFNFGINKEVHKSGGLEFKNPRSMDVDFRHDKDLRNTNSLGDKDFRSPFTRDKDYRTSRFDQEKEPEYEDDDDEDNEEEYTEERSWPQNNNFPNQFGGVRNPNFNPNFPMFRPPNFGRKDISCQYRPPGDDSFRGGRGVIRPRGSPWMNPRGIWGRGGPGPSRIQAITRGQSPKGIRSMPPRGNRGRY